MRYWWGADRQPRTLYAAIHYSAHLCMLRKQRQSYVGVFESSGMIAQRRPDLAALVEGLALHPPLLLEIR